MFDLETNKLFPPIQVPPDEAMGIERFVGIYLSHHLRDKISREPIKSPFFHREIYYIVSHPKEYPCALIVAPRGFSKSFITMLASPLYDALVGYKIHNFEEILLVAASQELAEKWLSKIKGEIENNELIFKDFGELSTDGKKGGKWAVDEIYLANGRKIMARGRGTSVRGLHPQKIAIDDIEGDEGALSQTECEKIDRWVKAAIIPMQLESGSVLHWDGTFLAPDSVLHRAYWGKSDGFGEEWFRYKRSALVDGKSIWPERFNEAWLEHKRRQMGTMIFNAEYMNEPVSSLNPIIRREWIRYYEEDQRPQFMYKIMAIDPAISTKDIADKTAFCIIGADRTPGKPQTKYYVLDVDEGHLDTNSIIRRTFDLYRAWTPDMVVIETTAYQQALADMIRHEARDRNMYLTIKEIKPHKDKVTRLMGVSPMVEAGDVYFRNTQGALIDQLLTFPAAAHDDMVDAFAYAMGELKSYWAYVDDETSYCESENAGPAIPMLGM